VKKKGYCGVQDGRDLERQAKGEACGGDGGGGQGWREDHPSVGRFASGYILINLRCTNHRKKGGGSVGNRLKHSPIVNLGKKFNVKSRRKGTYREKGRGMSVYLELLQKPDESEFTS